MVVSVKIENGNNDNGNKSKGENDVHKCVESAEVRNKNNSAIRQLSSKTPTGCIRIIQSQISGWYNLGQKV